MRASTRSELTTVSALEAKPGGNPQPLSVAAQWWHDPAVQRRWGWVEPAVWTPRMLTALERGVAGGKWFSLMDKVWRPANLRAAYARVAQNGGAAGVDHVSVDQFGAHRDAELARLQQALQDGSYQPQAIRRTYLDKPGSKEQRPLGIPTVRDRTVQGAVRQALEPIFERDFAEHSYGFRPRRGAKDALRRVNALLQSGRGWVVDADLKSYFDSIPHDRLLARVQTKISDGRVLALIAAFLKQPIREGQTLRTPTAGTPQGAVLSPLLANLYLDPLDHLLADRGFQMVRYADDFVILCHTPAEAEAALALVTEWVAAAGLQLHPTKTRLVHAAEPGGPGFEFLGYRFATSRRGHAFRVPRAKSLKKLRDHIRALTPRRSGQSLPVIIARVNRVLRGWYEYFKHSLPRALARVDGFVRRRLRCILNRRRRQRAHQRGPLGMGRAHLYWPNTFFTGRGLFTLELAHAADGQAARRSDH